MLEQFELVDVARKVVGVGSVGTRAWIALLLGRDGQDPLILQIKEAEASVLEEFFGASKFSNHGERVVTGQRLMQAESDIFLGWVHVDSGLDGQSRDFYGRQLKDWKGSAEIEQMVPKGLALYGGLCGSTLARAHARSGDRIAIASYLGSGTSFDRAILEFSNAYAEQNARRLQESDRRGRRWQDRRPDGPVSAEAAGHRPVGGPSAVQEAPDSQGDIRAGSSDASKPELAMPTRTKPGAAAIRSCRATPHPISATCDARTDLASLGVEPGSDRVGPGRSLRRGGGMDSCRTAFPPLRRSSRCSSERWPFGWRRWCCRESTSTALKGH